MMRGSRQAMVFWVGSAVVSSQVGESKQSREDGSTLAWSTLRMKREREREREREGKREREREGKRERERGRERERERALYFSNHMHQYVV